MHKRLINKMLGITYNTKTIAVFIKRQLSVGVFILYIYHLLFKSERVLKEIKRCFNKKLKRYQTINQTISKVSLLSPFRQYALDMRYLKKQQLSPFVEIYLRIVNF